MGAMEASCPCGGPEGRTLSKILEPRQCQGIFQNCMQGSSQSGAQSQKKTQEVISKIPRTAAYETSGFTNFSVLCPPLPPSTPIPVALAPHTLKNKMQRERRAKGGRRGNGGKPWLGSGSLVWLLKPPASGHLQAAGRPACPPTALA